MQNRGQLPFTVKLGWGIAELAVSTYLGLTIVLLLYYETQALGIEPWLAGIVLLIPRLWDAVTDPLMGALSDRTRTSMGRRRPYLLAGAILLGISVIALFSAPADASQTYKASYVLLFYFLASTAITIYDVPFSSMAAEMTTDYRERTLLTGYKMIFARIGILLVMFLGPYVFGKFDNLAEGFAYVGWGFGILIIISGLAGFVMTAQAPCFDQPIEAFNIKAEFRALIENRPFRALWIAFLMQNLAIGTLATTLLYMVIMVVRTEPDMVGTFTSISAVVATLATPFAIHIGRRIEKRSGYFITIAIAVMGTLPAVFVWPHAYAFMFAILVVYGISEAGTQLFPNSMVPDTVEVDELRTGERREGAIFGAWAFCRKFGMTMGAFLVSILLSLTGFMQGAGPEHQPENALLGVRFTFAVLPALLWVAAAILLTRYRLTEEEFRKIKTQIASRKQAQSADAGSASSKTASGG